MRSRFNVPPHFVFILIGVALAIFVNQKVEMYLVQVSGGFDSRVGTFSNQASREKAPSVEQVINASPSLKVDPPIYSTAGWPMKYYVECQFLGSEPRKVFSYFNLTLNVLIFAAAIGIYLLYERYLGQTEERVAKDGSKSFRRRIGLMDLMLLTTLVAAGFGYWRLLGIRAQKEEALAKEVESAGGVIARGALVPAPISKYLRLEDCGNFFRIIRAVMPEAKTELLAKVVEIETLHSLHLPGGDYDLRALDNLPKRMMLNDLRIVGRKLDAGAIATIAGCKSLQYLNLMRTNVTAAGIRALGDMPRLREMNLVHTDIKLSEFKDVGVSRTVQQIQLPHGPPGTTDELVIENWPELRGIQCFEFDTPMNSSEVRLRVRSCPQLANIKLDVLQHFDLELDDLPALKEVSGRFDQLSTRVKDVPRIGAPILTRVNFNAVPTMKGLGIFAHHLQSIKISNAPALELTCFFPTQHDEMFGGTASAGEEIDVEVRQRLVNDLGKCDGPARLSFTTMRVADLDLSPLKENKLLIELDLANSDFQDVRQLAGAGIEILRLPSRLLDSKRIETVARSLPKLSCLVLNPLEMQELNLSSVPTLKQIFPVRKSDFRSMAVRLPVQQIRLIDMPSLAENIDLPPFVRKVHLENVPSLIGLSFMSAMPERAVVRGLRDLRYFAAGGATMNDAVMQEVLNCKGLRRLTLAHSAVSPEVLKGIGEFPSLEYLVLTGSQVNDELFAGWSNLSELYKLALDKTQITSASLPKILSLKKLDSVAFDGNVLSDEAFVELGKSSRLKSLSIAGATLTRERMQALAKMISLKELDLSDCHFTNEAALPIIESVDVKQTLTKLILNRGKIDDQALNGFLLAFPNLKFELVDCDASPALVDILVRNRRAVVESFNAQNQMAMGMNGIGGRLYEAAPDGLIDEVDASLFEASPNFVLPQQNAYGAPSSMQPSNVSSFSTYEPLNPLEAIGAWIAEAAMSMQRTRKSEGQRTLE